MRWDNGEVDASVPKLVVDDERLILLSADVDRIAGQEESKMTTGAVVRSLFLEQEIVLYPLVLNEAEL